jgi:hypothetical protein
LCSLHSARAQISRSICNFTHYIDNNNKTNNNNLTINMQLHTLQLDPPLTATLRVVVTTPVKIAGAAVVALPFGFSGSTATAAAAAAVAAAQAQTHTLFATGGSGAYDWKSLASNVVSVTGADGDDNAGGIAKVGAVGETTVVATDR